MNEWIKLNFVGLFSVSRMRFRKQSGTNKVKQHGAAQPPVPPRIRSAISVATVHWIS